MMHSKLRYLSALIFLFSYQLVVAQVVESCYLEKSEDVLNRLSNNYPNTNSVITCDDLDKDTIWVNLSHRTNIRETKHCSALSIFLGYRTLDSRMDKKYFGICSYDQLKLKNVLGYGKKYKISIRLFFEDVALSDSLYFENSGLLLSNQKVNFQKDLMIETSNILPFGDVPTEEWFTKEWTIQPTCNINYLTFGSFRNGDWPASVYYQGGRSFLVESYQVELLDDDYSGDINQYNCFMVDNEAKVETKNFEIEFSYKSNSYNLSNDQKIELDSIATILIKDPSIIIGIEGFADSKGTDNEKLSAERVSGIKSYLLKKHKIPSIRILEIPKSDNDAILHNGNNISNVEFRKTIVYRSGLKAKNVMYRKLTENSKLNIKKNWISRWLLISSLQEKLVLYFNACFHRETLDVFKPIIFSSIIKGYKQSKLPTNCFQIDSLIYEDQKLITYNHDIQRLYGYDRNDPEDITIACNDFSPSLRDSLSSTGHQINLLIALNSYIDINGWPDKQIYNAKRVSELSLILVHQNEIEILTDNSNFIKPLCENGLAPWKTYALIEDKISRLKNEPQLYGTQWQLGDDEITLKIYKHVDEDVLQKARDSIGLPMIDLKKSAILNK